MSSKSFPGSMLGVEFLACNTSYELQSKLLKGGLYREYMGDDYTGY